MSSKCFLVIGADEALFPFRPLLCQHDAQIVSLVRRSENPFVDEKEVPLFPEVYDLCTLF